jgi:hypothetical protein
VRLPLRFALFLAVALLVATQGALVHPYVHDCEAAHAQAAGDGDHDGPGAGHACDLCMAFSALALAANGSAVAPLDAPSAVRALRDLGTAFLPRAPPAFRSQAPPFLS